MYARTVCALMTGCLAVAGSAASDQSQSTPQETKAGLECRVVMLKHANSELVARHMRALFEGKNEIHKVTWYGPVNAILMRATPDELKQMEYFVTQLDVNVPDKEEPAPNRKTRIFQIKHADAERLAVTVQRVIATCICSQRRRTESTVSNSASSTSMQTTSLALGTTSQTFSAEEAPPQRLSKSSVPMAVCPARSTRRLRPRACGGGDSPG